MPEGGKELQGGGYEARAVHLERYGAQSPVSSKILESNGIPELNLVNNVEDSA